MTAVNRPNWLSRPAILPKHILCTMVKQTVKERLAQYQEQCRKKREYEKAQKVGNVKRLDDEQINVSGFASPTRRRKSTAAPDAAGSLVGKIAGSMIFQGSSAPTPAQEKERIIKEERKAKATLNKVLRPYQAEAAPVKEETPFQGLQKRYLKAIVDLQPSPISQEKLSRAVRKENFKAQTDRRDEFLTVRHAWDSYEARAQDRPSEPTPEDVQVEAQIKKTENQVVAAWSNYAHDVVHDLFSPEDEDEEADSDDERILEWVDETHKMKQDNKERRRQKDQAYKEMIQRAQEQKYANTDKDLLEEAKRLREKHRQREQLKKERLAAGESISDIEAEEAAEALELEEESESGSEYTDDDEEGDEHSKENQPQEKQDPSHHEASESQTENAEEWVQKAKDVRKTNDYRTGGENFYTRDPQREDWLKEARRLREEALAKKAAAAQQQQANTSVDASESQVEGSEFDEEVVNEAKKLRRSHLLQRAQHHRQEDTDSSDDDSDSGDLALWIEAARQKRKSRRKKGSKNSDPVAEKADTTEASESPKDLVDAVKKQDGSNYQFRDPRMNDWLKEARKLRQDALAKKAGQCSSVLKKNAVADKIVVREALKLEQANEREHPNAPKQDASTWIEKAHNKMAARPNYVADGKAYSFTDPQREEWLEEARRLRAEAIAKKQAAAQSSSPFASVAETADESSSFDEEIVEEAQKLRRSHLLARAKNGYNSDSDEDEDDEDADDLALWIEAAKRNRKEKKRRKKLRRPASSEPVDETVVAELAESKAVMKDAKKNREDGSDYFLRDPRKEEWLKEARRLREAAIAKKKAAGHSEDDISFGTADNDSLVVNEALKLDRRFKTDNPTAIPQSPSELIDEARKRLASRPIYKEGGENYSFTDPRREEWLEEARRLKAEAAKKEGETTVQDSASEKEEMEEVIEEAQKLRRSHLLARARAGYSSDSDQDEDEEDADDLALWIEAAKRKRKSSKTKRRKSRIPDTQESARSKWIDVSSDDDSYDGVDEATKQLYLEEARKLKAEASKKRESENSAKNESSPIADDGSDPDEVLIRAAIKLEKVHRQVKAANEDSSSDEDDGSSRFLEEARRLRAQALARKEETSRVRSTRISNEKPITSGTSDSSDDDSEASWKKEARRLRREAIERERARGGKTLKKQESSSDESSDSDAYEKPKSKAPQPLTSKTTKAPARRISIVQDSSLSHVDESESSLQFEAVSPKRKPQVGDSMSFWDSFSEKVQRQSPQHRKKPTSELLKKRHSIIEEPAIDTLEDLGQDSSSSKRSLDLNESFKDSSVSTSNNNNESLSFWESFSHKVTSGKTAKALQKLSRKSSALGGVKESDEKAPPVKAEKRLSVKKKASKKSQLENENDVGTPSPRRKKAVPGKAKTKKKIVEYDMSSSDSEIETETEASEEVTSPPKAKKAAKRVSITKTPKKKKKSKYDDESSESEAASSSEEPASPLATKKPARRVSVTKTPKSKKATVVNKTVASTAAPSKKKKVGIITNSPLPQGKAKKKSKSKSKSKKLEKEENSESVSEATDVIVAPKTPKTPKKKKAVKLGDSPGRLKAKDENIDDSRWTNPLTGWLNKTKARVLGSCIAMVIPDRSECWRLTRGTRIRDDAPFHWMKVSGDFELICKISGRMEKEGDKAGLVIRVDEENWVFSGMEFSGDRMNSTTCVTLGSTDRSICPLPENAERAGIWFCIKRIGESFECFYSYDVRKWVQTRQGLLSDTPNVYVGISGASPRGYGFKAYFEFFKYRKFDNIPLMAVGTGK